MSDLSVFSEPFSRIMNVLKRSFRSELSEALKAQDQATKKLQAAYGIDDADVQ